MHIHIDLDAPVPEYMVSVKTFAKTVSKSVFVFTKTYFASNISWRTTKIYFTKAVSLLY